jgi:hypothetical protein
MSLNDEQVPQELENEYNKILGIEETKGDEEKSSHRRKTDDAYTEDTDPYLRESDEEEEQTEETDDEEVDEETGDDINPPDDEAEAEADEADEEVEIPDNWVMAGRSAGFSDEKIIKLFEEEPEILDALANTREQLLSASRTVETDKREVVNEEVPKPDKIAHVVMDDDTMDMDESTKRILKKFVDNQNAVIDKLNDANEKLFKINSTSVQRDAKEQDDFSRKIDRFFDDTKDINLGDSRALTQAQAHARKEVYGIAAMLANVNGESVTDNLDKAVKAYHGIYSNPERIAENNLRRKLDNQKKRFSPRPGGQKKAQKFKNDDERVMAAMEKAATDMGLNLG